MRSEAYFHVTADSQEEYDLLINLGVPWVPPTTGFIDYVTHTVFLVAPEMMPRILKKLSTSPRWCAHGHLDNEKACTEAWNRTCPIYIHKQLSGDGMEISKPKDKP